VSRFVEKFRKTKNYNKEEYGFEYDAYSERGKKKNKSERTQLKRMRTEEYTDYQFDNAKRIR
jgi:hypothetical protein